MSETDADEMERDPDAYLYDFRYGKDDDWVERATVLSPGELGYVSSDRVEVRNVRPLYTGGDE